ncbi:MAG: hypothetical protein DRQ97_08145 [Gammaproteobacteria bacterium]|nr:MAG: hypothetical protein DRQ97_08145 [Gammaproteobacteria bacterium]
MKYKVIVVLLAALAASGAWADIKPKCDAKKAARGKAMDATVGVSGRCDAEKAGKNAKKDVKGSVDRDKNRNQKKKKKNKKK